MTEPTNEQMAQECLHTAERAMTQEKAVTESMAAQTYATLALVDELRQLRESLACNVTDTVTEEVASGTGDAVCPECMGVNGSHRTLHIRYGNGWGGNVPCPRSKAVNA